MTDAIPELKPCPFCGSTNVSFDGWASLTTYGPACDDCGASAGEVSKNPADNIAAWNHRALDAETEVNDDAKPAKAAHVCRWCDGLGGYNCLCTGSTYPESRS